MTGQQMLFYTLAGLFAGFGFTVAQQLILALLALIGHRRAATP